MLVAVAMSISGVAMAQNRDFKKCACLGLPKRPKQGLTFAQPATELFHKPRGKTVAEIPQARGFYILGIRS